MDLSKDKSKFLDRSFEKSEEILKKDEDAKLETDKENIGSSVQSFYGNQQHKTYAKPHRRIRTTQSPSPKQNSLKINSRGLNPYFNEKKNNLVSFDELEDEPISKKNKAEFVKSSPIYKPRPKSKQRIPLSPRQLPMPNISPHLIGFPNAGKNLEYKLMLLELLLLLICKV